MKKCILYKKLKNNTVQCEACSHFCKIVPGKTGICGVRKNIRGDLFLLVYGKASSIGLDPIEKKPLFHFLPGSQVFSFGTIGCNFSCDFCQNAEISQAGKDVNIILPPMRKLEPKNIVLECLKYNIPTIAYTYNEPAIFF